MSEKASPRMQAILRPAPDLMTFTGAIQEIVMGKRVSRLEWNDRSVYCGIFSSTLMIYRGDEDELWHPWNVSAGDMIAVDWYLVD